MWLPPVLNDREVVRAEQITGLPSKRGEVKAHEAGTGGFDGRGEWRQGIDDDDQRAAKRSHNREGVPYRIPAK